MGVSQLTLGDDAKVIFAEDDIGNISSFEQLPYLFNDPHRMDKKIDVKKLQFGSRIDQSESKREELFSVKKVISPDKIELSNGLTVRLLGIKPNPLYQGEAISFLQEKFQKRKVLKTYIAVVHGAPKNKEGIVNLPIGIRSGSIRRTTRGGKMPKEAETHYELIKAKAKSGKIYSSLKISPKTGRTHQIRVHLKALGLPICGDEIYGLKRGDDFKRLMLHASQVEFPLNSKKKLKIKSALPKEFAVYIK